MFGVESFPPEYLITCSQTSSMLRSPPSMDSQASPAVLADIIWYTIPALADIIWHTKALYIEYKGTKVPYIIQIPSRLILS